MFKKMKNKIERWKMDRYVKKLQWAIETGEERVKELEKEAEKLQAEANFWRTTNEFLKKSLQKRVNVLKG